MPNYEFNMFDVVKCFSDNKIIPILALDTVEDGVRVCEIISKAGISAAEITFRTAAASETIKALIKLFPGMLIGAGTILNRIDLEIAMAAGAQFALSPGCNPTVVKAAREHKLPFFPVCPTRPTSNAPTS